MRQQSDNRLPTSAQIKDQTRMCEELNLHLMHSAMISECKSQRFSERKAKIIFPSIGSNIRTLQIVPEGVHNKVSHNLVLTFATGNENTIVHGRGSRIWRRECWISSRGRPHQFRTGRLAQINISKIAPTTTNRSQASNAKQLL